MTLVISDPFSSADVHFLTIIARFPADSIPSRRDNTHLAAGPSPWELL